MANPTVNGSVTTAIGGPLAPSVTVAHTINAGLSNGLLLAFVNCPQFAAPTTATWNVTSPMAPLAFTAGNYFCKAFYLQNPVAGTHNFTANWSIFSSNIGITLVTLKDAGVPDVKDTGSGSSALASDSVTTLVNNSLVFDFVMSQATTHAQGVGQTELSNYAVNTYRQSVSSKPAPTAGATPMSVTMGGSVTWQITSISVPPAGVATGVGQIIII